MQSSKKYNIFPKMQYKKYIFYQIDCSYNSPLHSPQHISEIFCWYFYCTRKCFSTFQKGGFLELRKNLMSRKHVIGAIFEGYCKHVNASPPVSGEQRHSTSWSLEENDSSWRVIYCLLMKNKHEQQYIYIYIYTFISRYVIFNDVLKLSWKELRN